MINPREIAFCGVFGAAAMLLPVIFHVFHLGSAFMPMYLPLVTLAFFVRPLPAALTAFLLPLLSGAVMSMPPFYPPVAFIMAAELAFMCGTIAAARSIFPKVNVYAVLVIVLAAGRCVNVGLVYGAAQVMTLPAKFIAGVSFISGWPGIILMLAVIPAVLRLYRPSGRPEVTAGGTHG